MLTLGSIQVGQIILSPTVVSVGLVILAVFLGIGIFLDARRRGHRQLAPFAAFVVGGLFLAGATPGLVAFAIAQDAAAQGFPTAIRVVPGFASLVIYVFLR